MLWVAIIKLLSGYLTTVLGITAAVHLNWLVSWHRPSVIHQTANLL